MFQLLNLIVTIVFMLMIFSSLPWSEMMAAPGGQDQISDPNEVFEQIGIFFWIGIALFMIWSLGIFIPSIAVTIRRLHDRDMSGWWYGGLWIAGFIPLVNILAIFGYLALLVVLCLPGTEGPNRYGPDPMDPYQTDAFS